MHPIQMNEFPYVWGLGFGVWRMRYGALGRGMGHGVLGMMCLHTHTHMRLNVCVYAMSLPENAKSYPLLSVLMSLCCSIGVLSRRCCRTPGGGNGSAGLAGNAKRISLASWFLPIHLWLKTRGFVFRCCDFVWLWSERLGP